MRATITITCATILAVLASMLSPGPAAAATTFVVTSTADTGGACTPSACTLRAAINAANSTAGGSVITFNIAPGGRQTIAVASQLPALTATGLVLDGTTQPNTTGPGIRIDNPRSTNTDTGLVVRGSGITVRGVAITRFGGLGIHLFQASGSTLSGSWIGTADGTTAAGNTNVGVYVEAGSGNTIGGPSAASRNVIGGTRQGWAGDGIQIHDSNLNVVVGNYVGMAADGVTKLPNADTGIEISGSSTGNRIGGLSAGERNLATGNDGIGLQLLGVANADGSCDAPASNVIQGNWIGVDANGARPGTFGNGGEGVAFQVCSRDNLLGGTSAGARNVVSGNRDDGVKIEGLGGPSGGTCNNRVQGNYIGMDPTGSFAVANRVTGVKVQNGACNTQIGGSEPGAGNVISGNLSDAIYIRRATTVDTVIEGNVIGLAPDRSRAIGNGDTGVHIWSGSKRTVVRNNVISANAGNGILIENPGTNSSSILGNRIGMNDAATAARPNKRNGVWITDGAQSSLVQDNVIAANTQAGVVVERQGGATTATTKNRVTRNRIEANGGLGIDLLPSAGVNLNDGNSANSSIGNNGMDFPVIVSATSSSARGTAPAGATVEVFQVEASPQGANGEGARFLAATTADAAGAWCVAGLIITGSVTATATDATGNTSEFATNRATSDSGSLCGGASPAPSPTAAPTPPPTAPPTATPTATAPPTAAPTATPTPTAPPGSVIFSADFSGPDGTVPAGWVVTKSAGGAGAGAVIQSNRLRETVALSAGQDGIFQYVEARATSGQPSWAEGAISVRWQSDTLAGSNHTGSLVLSPVVTSSNIVNQADYLRLRVANGSISIVRRVAGGTASTLWSGTLTSSAALRGFELRLDAQSVSLLEGPIGGETLRVGPIAHGIPWQSASLYLHGQSSTAASTYVQNIDNVVITRMGAAQAPATSTPTPTPISTPTVPPTPAPGGEAVVVAAGDIACSPLNSAYNGGDGTADECRQRAVSDLVLDIDPDVALTLGDHQYMDGTLAEFMAVYDVTWGRFKGITRPAIGNHEYGTSGASGYFTYFGAAAGPAGKGWYSYDIGDWHVVVLNSMCDAAGGCDVGSEQEQWLRADLAANAAQCTLAYWHHPRFSSGSHGPYPETAPLWEALQADGAEIVLSGHDHVYERFAPQTAAGTADPEGIRQFVVGTGGANHVAFEPALPNSLARNATTFGVLKLTLRDGSYAWAFVPEQPGGYTDSGQANCH